MLVKDSVTDSLAVIGFHSAYSDCIDQGRFEEWPEFFIEGCDYKIQARENFDAGLPLSILWLNGQAMLLDRIYGIRETLYHDPYYSRHIVSTPRITSSDEESVSAETNYLVIRTKRDSFSEIFNVGRYIDRFQRTRSGLKIISRNCVFDSEWIRNSIIYPI